MKRVMTVRMKRTRRNIKSIGKINGELVSGRVVTFTDTGVVGRFMVALNMFFRDNEEIPREFEIEITRKMKVGKNGQHGEH